MNNSRGAFIRYKFIDTMLRNPYRPYPTLEQIADAFFDRYDIDYSTETFYKDIKNMRAHYPDGFDAPIKYSGTHNGYYYTDPEYSFGGVSLRPEELSAIEEALEVISAIGGSRISENFNHAMEKLLSATKEVEQSKEDRMPILQMMAPPTSRGFESFDTFFKSCKEKIPVSFIHFSYKKREYKHIILHPFLIKEFENRWYVIGFSETHNDIRTFGLDRITAPMLLKKKYITTESETRKAYHNDVYGVFPIPGAKKEKVEIHVSQLGTHYFQAYPLHKSQKIKKENFGTSIITYEVIPSVELARYFLSQGYHVETVKPKWFNKFIQDLTE